MYFDEEFKIKYNLYDTNTIELIKLIFFFSYSIDDKLVLAKRNV